jgi:hypothetical protein
MNIINILPFPRIFLGFGQNRNLIAHLQLMQKDICFNGDSFAIFQKHSNKSLWQPQPPAVYRKQVDRKVCVLPLISDEQRAVPLSWIGGSAGWVGWAGRPGWPAGSDRPIG